MAGNFGKDTTTIAISITFHKLSKYDLSPVFTPRIKNPLIYKQIRNFNRKFNYFLYFFKNEIDQIK